MSSWSSNLSNFPLFAMGKWTSTGSSSSAEDSSGLSPSPVATGEVSVLGDLKVDFPRVVCN